MWGTAKEKLDHLLSICDKRLREITEYPYRMTAVCARIPSIIDDADLGRLGYHKQCYADFVKNLDRCQADQSSTENEESAHQNALAFGVHKIQSSVIQNNKIVQLSITVHCKTQRKWISCVQICDGKLRQLLSNQEMGSQIAFTTSNPENKCFISYGLMWKGSVIKASSTSYCLCFQ